MSPVDKANRALELIQQALLEKRTIWIRNPYRQTKFRMSPSRDVRANFKVFGSELRYTRNFKEWFPLVKFYKSDATGEVARIQYETVLVD